MTNTTATWTVWTSHDRAHAPTPTAQTVTRDRAVELVTELQANGQADAYALDTSCDDNVPDNVAIYDGPTVAVTDVESMLHLPSVKKFRTGEDGTLVRIDYRYDPYYPHVSGPLLHFQLPDGRTVLTAPDGDGGFQLAWADTLRYANGQVDDGAIEVIHLMWGEITEAFHTLTRRLLDAAIIDLGDALSTP
jgi:hypothetical protein